MKEDDQLLIPDVDKIFKSVSTYAVHTNDLKQQFSYFKSKINGVKAFLESLKREKNALEIFYLLQNTLLEFGIWVDNVAGINIANQKYVKRIQQIDKNTIKTNMRKIKKFQLVQMNELKNKLREHENVAVQQRDNLNKFITLVHHEMNKRNIVLNKISEHFKTGDNSSESLSNILKESKTVFSHQTDQMLEITSLLKSCIEVEKENFDDDLIHLLGIH